MIKSIRPGTSAAPNTLRFAVLGPLAVRRGDVDHTPRTPKLTHVLTILLLDANRVVPLRDVVDELWSIPPKLAKKTVQTYVYQLRKDLGQLNEVTGGPLIETHANGYCIRLEKSQLDLWEFDELVDQGVQTRAAGDDRGAAALFREALDVWRGMPLSDIEFGVGMGAKIAALEDRRIEVLEKRIDADLALGRHRSLVGELKGITTRYPLHEVFCAQLMTAAQRSGLRSDALDAYQRLRRAMVDEIGLEPSARLRQLQQEALESSPTSESIKDTSAAPHVGRPPAQLPADIADFVGREDELASLLEHAIQDDLVPSPGAVMLIAGPSGIGKTALAIHTAQRLRGRFPDGQLFVQLHNTADQAVDPAAALAASLRALGVRNEDVPEDLGERAGLFRTWTTGKRLLVVLDDAATGDQVGPLLPSGDGSLAIVTARHRIPELSFVHTLELEPMTVDEGVALLSHIADKNRIGHQLPAARDVVELCDRLPLAIRIAGQKLVARRAWPVRKLADRLADTARRLGELSVGQLDLAEHLERVCNRLWPADRNALAALTRLGPDWFDLSAASKALRIDCLAAESPVGTLVNENLLLVTGLGHGGGAAFRFPELVRLYGLHNLATITELAPGSPEHHRNVRFSGRATP